MMTLDLDIGNTRIKWLLRPGPGEEETARGACQEVQELLSQLEEKALRPARVRVSCVATPEILRAIDLWLAARGLPACEQASTTSHGSVVKSAYKDPQQMGVDRWLAVCAGWHRAGRACVIADAGSALNIEFIDPAANYLGGYIVPGLSMQRASLRQATEKVRFEIESHQGSLGPGTTTGQAVQRGIIRMLAGLIEGAVKDFSNELGCEVSLLLTGGDAALVGRYLDIEYTEVPDLVFEGIDLVMG